MTEWKRKENRYHMVSHEGKDGLIYLTFPVLDGAESVRHLFSTRKGSVSRWGNINKTLIKFLPCI